MKINNISFGTKIPLQKCKIRDNKNNEFIDATFYEILLDNACEIEEVRKLKIPFASDIAQNMDSQLKHKASDACARRHYYALGVDNGDIAGICQCEKINDKIYVTYLASEQNGEYKYVGQNILASLGKDLLNANGEAVKIIPPIIQTAVEFYEKCAFRECSPYGMVMQSEDIPSFIQMTEKKTGAPIINLKAWIVKH